MDQDGGVFRAISTRPCSGRPILGSRGFEDEVCSQALVSASGKTSVRVIGADEDWPVRKVRNALKDE